MARCSESTELLPVGKRSDTDIGDRAGPHPPASPRRQTPLSVQGCALLLMVALGAASSYMTGFLVQLNHQVRLGTSDGGKPHSRRDMGAALGVYFVARVVGRQFHAILNMQPLRRAIAGMSTTAIGLGVLFIGYFAKSPPLTDSVYPFAFALLLSGWGFGVAESNAFSLLAAYGPTSKIATTVGFIVGWSGIAAVTNTFYLCTTDSDKRFAFESGSVVFGIVLVVASICWLGCGLPPPPSDVVVFSETFSKFIADCAQWRQWVPHIAADAGTLFAVGFSMTFSYVALESHYASTSREVLPGVHLSPIGQMAAYAYGGVVFGVASGLACLRIERHQLLNCVLSLACVGSVLTDVPFLGSVGAWLGVVAMAVSSGASSANIDATVDPEFNLSATSLWLQSWDVGTLLGSALAVVWGSHVV